MSKNFACRAEALAKAGANSWLFFLCVFYEASPVKLKICLIGSTFYPSFHKGFYPVFSWSHSTYTITPILSDELEAQDTNQAVVIPINTNFKLSQRSNNFTFSNSKYFGGGLMKK